MVVFGCCLARAEFDGSSSSDVGCVVSALHTSTVLHYPIQGIEQLTLTVTVTNLERRERERERILVYHV